MRKFFCIVVIMGCMFSQVQAKSANEGNHVEFGIGLTLGSELGDMIEAMDRDLTGFKHFFTFDLGVSFEEISGFQIIPRVRYFVNRQNSKPHLPGMSGMQLTMGLLPGISGRYWIPQKGNSRFYAQLDFALMVWGWSDLWEDLRGDGLSFGLTAGVLLGDNHLLSLGYYKASVEAESYRWPASGNFGGFNISLTRSF